MAIYGITGVKLSERGMVEKASICLVDPQTNQWLGRPTTMVSHELASLIYRGDEIYAIFAVDGHTVCGPKFRYVVYAGGRESIELAEDIEGRRLGNLVIME